MLNIASSQFLILLSGFICPSIGAKGPIGEMLDVAAELKPMGLGVEYAEKHIEKVATNYENQAYEAIERQVAGSVPIGKWALNPELFVKEMTSKAKFPKSDTFLPEKLQNLKLKSHYKSSFGGVSGFGVYQNIGQSTDELFASLKNTNYDITPYVSIGVEPKTAFVFFVNMANDRIAFNYIPAPGFAYGLRLSPKWGINLGFPHFGLWAEPFDWFKLNFSMEPVSYLDGDLLIDTGSWFNLKFRILSQQETYKLENRQSTADQLIYTSLTYSTGINLKLGPANFDLEGGWEMNRNFLETNDYLRERKNHVLRLANGVMAKVQARANF